MKIPDKLRETAKHALVPVPKNNVATVVVNSNSLKRRHTGSKITSYFGQETTQGKF